MSLKEIKDLTIEDLLAEGRRWVPFPGEPVEGGFRLRVVFENHPLLFLMGTRSNDPLLPPPVVVTSDDPDQWCEQWALANGLVKSPEEYMLLIANSIGAQNKAMEIHVFHDDLFVLSDGYGNTLTCDEDHALRLYQKLAAHLGLPHQVYCPICNDPLMDYEVCSCEATSK